MSLIDSAQIAAFPKLPDEAVVSLRVGSATSTRSRATLYRDNKAGKLPFVKVGNSTCIKVGDLRKYIAGEVAA